MEPIASAVGSWTRADLVDADSSEDRLFIAAIQSEESPNCCYAVEYTPCAADVKITRWGFGLVMPWFGTTPAFLSHRHDCHIVTIYDFRVLADELLIFGADKMMLLL